MRGRAVVVVVVALTALLAACDEAAPPQVEPKPSGGSAPTGSQAPTSSPPTTPEPLVVVAHATPAPAAAQPAPEAADLVARRGTGREVARTVRAVERRPRRGSASCPLSQGGADRGGRCAWTGGDPVRDHAGATTLLVTGDVMLVRGVPDPAAALAPLTPLLRGFDLTVGNLESTLSDDGRPSRAETRSRPTLGDVAASSAPGSTPSRWPTTTPATTRTPRFRDRTPAARQHDPAVRRGG